MDEHPVILFDGVCNLCNNSVNFVIRHDPDAQFRFATLQSETGRKLKNQYGITSEELNSFILISDNKAYTRSTAALKVAGKLKGIVKLMYGFIIVPPFIRNIIYDLISRNRYKWFGRKESCMVPTAALEKRFLN